MGGIRDRVCKPSSDLKIDRVSISNWLTCTLFVFLEMSTNRDLKLNVRHFVQESRNALRHNESTPRLLKVWAWWRVCWPAIQRETIPTNLPYTMDQLPEVSVEFMIGSL